MNEIIAVSKTQMSVLGKIKRTVRRYEELNASGKFDAAIRKNQAMYREILDDVRQAA